MALDLLALSGVSVAGSIATLSVAYDHAIRLCAVTRSRLTAAATGHVVAALTDAYCAKNTRRAYVRGWERWRTWASEHGVRSFPAAPKWVTAYLNHRAESGRAPATVRLDRAAIGAAHRAVEAVDPTASRAARRALRSIGTTYSDRGRGQVDGLNCEDVDRTAALAQGDGSLAGVRDAALLLLGSDALLRVSELAALVVSDLCMKPDGSGTITVRRSKTDQQGRGHVRYVGRPTVEAVQRYLKAAGTEAGALFFAVNKGRAVRTGLGVRSIRRIITQRAAAAGIVGRISGHSLRVGAVQSLVAAGASLIDLQRAGDWKSPSMPAYYARHQLAERGAVARLRHGVAA